MSASIWTRCAGSSRFARLACEPWRVVEAQHVTSTRKLVDSLAEQEALERLLDESKPALPPDPRLARLHFLLFTPFRYPPLKHGSRFGRRHEGGVWYGSESIRTALAEVAYYRLVFFEGTKASILPNTTEFSAFQARVGSGAGVDLTKDPFARYRARISSRASYAESQRLGTEMRRDGVEAFRYESARDPGGGTNVGLFSPAAFAAKAPIGPAETWSCTVTAERDVELVRRDVVAVRRVLFRRRLFLVNGELPAPAF